MNWIYIAGLFDGDGNFAICKRNNNRRGFAVGLTATITNNHYETMNLIVSYMKQFGITVCKTKNKYQIYRSNDVLEFINNVFPHLYIKRKQAEIMLRAFDLKKIIKSDKNRKITHEVRLFDELRHQLSDLNCNKGKGSKPLKQW